MGERVRILGDAEQDGQADGAIVVVIVVAHRQTWKVSKTFQVFRCPRELQRQKAQERRLAGAGFA